MNLYFLAVETISAWQRSTATWEKQRIKFLKPGKVSFRLN